MIIKNKVERLDSITKAVFRVFSFLFLFFWAEFEVFAAPSVCSVSGTLITSRTQVCSGVNSFNLSLSGLTSTTTIVGWYQSSNLGIWTLSSTSKNLNQSVSNISNTTYYRASISNNGCTVNTNIVTVTAVNLNGGLATINGSNQLCFGSSGTILLQGQTGNVYKWISSIDDFQNNIKEFFTTTPSFNFSNIQTTTSFKAVVTVGGICPNVFSSEIKINVIQSDTGRILAPSPPLTVCGGSVGSGITIDPQLSAVIKWQYSTDNFNIDIKDIPNSNTNSIGYNVFYSTYYRAVLQRGNCQINYSSPIKITIKDEDAAGSILGSNIICASTSGSGNLTFTGLGSILRWESSTDNLVYSDLGFTGTVYPFSGLTGNNYFRVITSVPSGLCQSSNYYSKVGRILVGGGQNAAGQISPSSYPLICDPVNKSKFTLNNYAGEISHWESCSDNSFPINLIPGTVPGSIGQSFIEVSNVLNSTYYRAIVKGNASCPQSISNTVTITSTPVSDVVSYSFGSSFTAATVCSGSKVIITAGSHTGNIIRWESSSNEIFAVTIDHPVVTSTFEIDPVKESRYYRAIVQNGNCILKTKPNDFKLEVEQKNYGTLSLGSTGTLCITSNSGMLQLKNYVGTVSRWEKSTALIDPFPPSGYTVTTNDIFSTGVITIPTYFKVLVEPKKCESQYSNILLVTVDSLTKSGILQPLNSPVVCQNANTGTITLTGGYVANNIRWEESSDNFLSISKSTQSNSNIYSFNNLTTTSKIRAVIQNGACPATTTSFVTISTSSPPVGGISSGPSEVCESGSVAVFNLSGQKGWPNTFESSIYPDSGFTNSTKSILTSNQTSFTKNNILKSTYSRFWVTKAPCLQAAYSNVILTKTSPLPSSGSISGLGNIIVGQSTTLTLSGFKGIINSWETSTNSGFSTFNTVASSSSIFGLNSLTKDSFVRANILSGTCPKAVTPVFPITLSNDLICRDTLVFQTLGKSISTATSFSLLNLTSTNSSTGTNIQTVSNAPTLGALGRSYSIYPSGYWSYSTILDTLSDQFNYTVCLNSASNYCKTCKVKIYVEDTAKTVTTYSAFSPNQDKINDTWIVDNLEAYPSNKVSIFNRWGNLVFQETGYDNLTKVFKGESNVEMVIGDRELPVGTYFYVIDYGNGKSFKKGYIVLNR